MPTRGRDGVADEVLAVVADVGSHTSKFGFSGEENPKCTFPSVRLPALRAPLRGTGPEPAPFSRVLQSLVKEGDTLHVGDAATGKPRAGCPVVNPFELGAGSPPAQRRARRRSVPTPPRRHPARSDRL